jgi:TonB-linked SusC/RagA family outer membrane protein
MKNLCCSWLSSKHLLLALLLFLGAPEAFSQVRTISGNVSTESGETLPGVNILISGSTRGTVSDIDGNFSIVVQPGDRLLKFSFTGYEEQDVSIGQENNIKVVLVEKSTMLDEYVVIGYGVVKKSDLTGAVSSVKSEDLLKTTSSNPIQSLQGKAAGVQVTTTSGAPGAGLSVRIRGVGTLNNSEPIYVVDGVIMNDVSFLNTSDIASMEVLKDASATAIYGSRGANGVVMITTKRGTLGQTKTNVSFSSEFGLQRLAKKIDLLNGKEFATIANEIKPGSYNNVDAVPNTDWQDEVFRTAPIHNHQLSITGASEKSEYYAAIGIYRQDGIIPKSSYQRISIKLNNAYHINKHVTTGINLTLSPYEQQNAPNVTYSVYRAQPLLVPYYPDGSFGVVYNVGNPLADLEYSNSYNRGLRGVGNIYTDIKLGNDFTFRSSYGMDAGINKSDNFTPAYTIYNPDGTASQQYNEFSDLSKSTFESRSWLWENTLTWLRDFGKHRINSVAGYTMQQTRSEFTNLVGQNIIRNESDFWYILPSYIIDEANNINMVNSISNGVETNLYYNMISYLFRANYTYDNKYIFTATFRRDGSSKFTQNNRFADFPSFAAGWNLINEPFMSDQQHITTLKFRASWGKIGNEKIPYLNQYSVVDPGLVAIFSNPDAFFAAASYAKLGNPDLKWESTSQTDIGLEIGLFNNRLMFETDYYHKVTDDILVELSTPGHMGNGQGQRVTYNAASVLNRGLEANLSWRDQTGGFVYKIGLLGTTIHNEVLEIGGNSGIDSVLMGGYLGNGIPVTQTRIGLPIGAFYGYKTDGIFQTQEELDAYPHLSQAGVGDLRFVDTNGDGKLNGLDRTYIGSPIPKFVFGLNIELEYKSFDLTFDLQGQTGNKIFNGKDAVRPDPYNFEQNVWDRWKGQGTSNSEPKPSFGGYNYIPSDRFLLDGSFIRLRNIIVGYSFPEKLMNRIQVNSARIYLKGSNLFTLTKFTGYTPEIGGGSVLSNGIDNGIYPIAAVYSVGLNLTF